MCHIRLPVVFAFSIIFFNVNAFAKYACRPFLNMRNKKWLVFPATVKFKKKYTVWLYIQKIVFIKHQQQRKQSSQNEKLFSTWMNNNKNDD